MSNIEGQIIKVRIASGGSTISEVFHDNTLTGTGQPGSELGVAESVLQDIASKVSDVQVNGESVVAEGVANITVGDATITIQKNGTDVDSFTVNETTDKTINVEVPTTLRELSTVAEQAVLDSGITSADVEQITTNKNDISTANGEINTINSKIPSTASSENKLTDKDYVDGEISTVNGDIADINSKIPSDASSSNKLTDKDYVDGEISTLSGEISSLDGDITDINSKIPAQASAENKLADKNFVNSSIATNTANFIGTFNSVAELEAYSGTLTNNDYAFVVSEDSAGNTIYNRYKYTTATTPASWVFEYELNNSSFTSDQWAAINSGATTTNIGQIATNTSTISGHIADKNNPHQVTKSQVGLGNVDNTSDVNKPVSTAQQTALNGKANIALDNLTSVGKNIGNWSSNVSNCITEIPQDINLTLSDGTLTLKAGSKVYVPNGAGVFDIINITTDKTTTSATDGQRVLVLDSNNNLRVLVGAARFTSGSTDSMAGITYHGWYDTTNNIINYYTDNVTTPDFMLSFPLAIVTVSGGQISSIDQVFNGFGYIGSTLFMLPGLKGLIPDGINTDGTLKSTSFTVSQVRTQSDIGGYTSFRYFATNGVAISSSEALNYNAKTNYNTIATGNWDRMPLATFDLTVSGGTKTITNFKPNYVFHALDYNDSNYIANCAMPSSRYTDLTLGNDNDPLTAPADGYYMLSKTSGATGERVGFQGRVDSFVYSSDSGQGLAVYIPVRKGDTVSVRFTATGATNRFRFIYANGAK